MTYYQVIQTIKAQYPDAVEKATAQRCPSGLDWIECICGSKQPWVFKARGPKGGGHALGIALQAGLRIISYGPVGKGNKTCCSWFP